eukprot:scaffold60286_cov24-Tisochrysis_lutea.AAC.1
MASWPSRRAASFSMVSTLLLRSDRKVRRGFFFAYGPYRGGEGERREAKWPCLASGVGSNVWRLPIRGWVSSNYAPDCCVKANGAR